ncbi:hypothetical protein [Erythrobacter rubeus]|uniref:Uncharacterized protein n=1 Tax=Erythrobacter rubeus TaxID=2760803 RepID=A0ABR8KS61_9SPHN|nr:hypothetical protein [Erythrobacter rubeus]MBD2841908.1 hypothetical protein [Erythrobacter rubeus]
MANKPLPEAHQLQAVIDSLDDQLVILDDFGAGIAAIHVNAAIEQLHSNLSAITNCDLTSYDPAILCLLPGSAG